MINLIKIGANVTALACIVITENQNLIENGVNTAFLILKFIVAIAILVPRMNALLEILCKTDSIEEELGDIITDIYIYIGTDKERLTTHSTNKSSSLT